MQIMELLARELAEDPNNLAVRFLARAFEAIDVAQDKARNARTDHQAEVWAAIARAEASAGDLAASIQGMKPVMQAAESHVEPSTPVGRTPDTVTLVKALMRRMSARQIVLSDADIEEARGFGLELVNAGNGRWVIKLDDLTV